MHQCEAPMAYTTLPILLSLSPSTLENPLSRQIITPRCSFPHTVTAMPPPSEKRQQHKLLGVEKNERQSGATTPTMLIPNLPRSRRRVHKRQETKCLDYHDE